jgi:hypothetical protein
MKYDFNKALNLAHKHLEYQGTNRLLEYTWEGIEE